MCEGAIIFHLLIDKFGKLFRFFLEPGDNLAGNESSESVVFSPFEGLHEEKLFAINVVIF